jgi:hypothetical protein
VEAEQKRLIVPIFETEDNDMTAFAMTAEARSAYQPIAPALRKLRDAVGHGLTDAQLAEKIEERFGAWIAKHICRVLGVEDYACLQMAVLVAKEDDGPPGPVG